MSCPTCIIQPLSAVLHNCSICEVAYCVRHLVIHFKQHQGAMMIDKSALSLLKVRPAESSHARLS